MKIIVAIQILIKLFTIGYGADAVRTTGRFTAPAAAGKRADTCGFYPLNSRFPLFLSLAQTRDRRSLRNRGTAEDFFYRRGAQCAPMSLPVRSVRFLAATHTGSSTQAQHNSVAQLVSLEFTDSTCECRRLVQFIFVETVRNNALTNRAALLSPRGPSLALWAIHLVPHPA